MAIRKSVILLGRGFIWSPLRKLERKVQSRKKKKKNLQCLALKNIWKAVGHIMQKHYDKTMM